VDNYTSGDDMGTVATLLRRRGPCSINSHLHALVQHDTV